LELSIVKLSLSRPRDRCRKGERRELIVLQIIRRSGSRDMIRAGPLMSQRPTLIRSEPNGHLAHQHQTEKARANLVKSSHQLFPHDVSSHENSQVAQAARLRYPIFII
jgi:hypothetical protein